MIVSKKDTIFVKHYEMILNFSCKDTEKVWNGERTRKWSDVVVKMILRKLFMLHAAHRLIDLRAPPSNRLHPLKKDLKGYYSISVNMQWRIIFMWADGKATNVSVKDYH